MSNTIKLTGYVGKGKGYDSSRQWPDHLTEVFGYKPFEGTLNIAIRPKLTEPDVKDKDVVKPFNDFVCFSGTINNVPAHFCYSLKRKDLNEINTFYVISEHKLRDKLNLKDKDTVIVEIS